jgi:phosphate transport system permease protein
MPETVTREPGTTASGSRTTVPARAARHAPPEPRPLSILRAGDVLSIIGAAAAALALSGLLWTELAPFTGVLGYVVVTWLLFAVFYAALIAFDENRPTVRDRISAVVVQSLGLLVVCVLLFVIAYTIFEGLPAITHANFYTQDMRAARPADPLTKGGVVHAVLGTLLEVGIAMAIAIPLGLLAAVFLAEVPGRLSRFVRTVVEAMTALPDILAGLFIYATLILVVFHRPSGFAAACALAVTAIPIVCRAADVVLRLVPGGLTEASYALGSSHWSTVRLVTLPTARSGLATAVILGTARAIGETAPVLLTSQITGYTNLNPFSGSMESLPLMAFKLTQEPEPGEVSRGFGAAVVLLALVIVLFTIARLAGGRGAGVLTPRQQRRRAAASRRDLARYERRAHGATAMQGNSGDAP